MYGGYCCVILGREVCSVPLSLSNSGLFRIMWIILVNNELA